ncbi:hypothetical protein SRABI76_00595 [Microbacterium oxydans]|uniref:Uncharacterized protein n=1 Tax=Microbacterium oxydans TaxID=82380 RepID=A0A0F0L6T2_9MICO|nr:hypothetical protein [Microbacterium oxydans]KJL28025.1 hypothetical protein RS83_03089 [Microbacterium oxydans]CAH0143211.1 hypothetical protein SRABI76_00595 [Microbacterium oxydans]
MSSTDRNDISTEPSPGPEENDNLGAEDGKGTPPTVPPTDSGDETGGPDEDGGVSDTTQPDQD